MWYDLFILGVLIYCTVKGAKRGVIWQLAGIAGIVLCVFFAGSFAAYVGPLIRLEPPLNHWATMFTAYLFFSFLSFSVARMLNGWIEKAQLKEFNQHLGALLGFVKGVAICLVLTFFVVTVSEPAREALSNSRTGHYSAVLVEKLHPIIPGNLHDALEKYIHQLDTPEMRERYAREHVHDHEGHEHGSSIPAGETGATDPFGLPVSLGNPSGADPFAISDPFATNPPSSSVPVSSIPAGAAPPLPDSGAPGSAIPSRPAAGLFDVLAAQLPALLGQDLGEPLRRTIEGMDPQSRQLAQDRLLTALQNTRPEDRAALREALIRGGSSQLINVLGQWRDGRPAASSSPAPGSSIPGGSPRDGAPPAAAPLAGGETPAPALQRSQLLEAISAQFSTFPQAKKTIQEDINRQLIGVPDAVALRVLDDWRADLWGTRPDPDAGTNISSTLDERILRQLQAAGVPLDRLSGALQNRLGPK